jgi:hypothetical protein
LALVDELTCEARERAQPRLGRADCQLFVTGDSQMNSIIGGQATTLADNILRMSDSTLRIEPKITILPSK